MDHEVLWRTVLGEVELEISRANFATWFQNTSIKGVTEGIVTICVPNAFAKEWLEKKFHKNILRSLRANSTSVRNAVYAVVSADSAAKLSKRGLQKPREPLEEQLEFKEFSVDRETNLNPKYLFENFIIGSFNELAHAAAQSVTKNMGSLYNPLFIYGGVGLGKTHLLHAIGNKVKSEHPSYKVLYLTSERFVNELISLIQDRQPLHAFKEKYRNVDVLIIDDIQFIAGKPKTEEEFFHTFNFLYEHGKQVVFSSDKPPQAIQCLEERLRSRFEAGLTTDISEPEYEARIAILKSKTADKEYAPPYEVLEYIASVIQKNIRELEGALNLIVAKSKLKERQLTFKEAKDALDQLSRLSQKVVTTSQIIKTVAEFYDLPERDLFERSRRREVVRPRQIAMYLLRDDFHGSFPFIGQKLGGRDHTTALHACDKISKELKNNVKLVEELRLIRERLYKN